MLGIRRLVSLCLFLLVFHFNQLAFANIEKKLTGTIEVISVDDLKNGKSETKYFLNTSDTKSSESIELELNDEESSLFTGQKVEINCIPDKDKICVVKKLRMLSKQNETKTQQTGTLNTLWMIVDVADSSVALTTDQIKAKMDMTDNWFQEASFNQLRVDKDVNGDGQYDLYRMKLDDFSRAADGCDYKKLRTLALAKMEAQGVDINLYKHDVLVMPPLGCGWSGLGHVGCANRCAAWIQGVSWDLVYPHELGHNIKMRHASTDPENDGIVNSEYGDGTCAMGNRLTQGYFNAPHSYQMGWITENNGQIATLPNKAGDYTLPAFGPDKGQPIVYRFTADKDYYLSYRNLGTFDKVTSEYTTGVTLHYMVPTGKTRYIKTYAPGEEYIQDTFQIKSIATGNDSTQVRVELCNLTPEVTVNKPYSIVKLGEIGTVKFTITYPEEQGCSPVQYSLVDQAPGLKSKLSVENITLNPGESKVVDLSFVPYEAKEYNFSLEVTTVATGSKKSLETTVLASYGDADFKAKLLRSAYSGTWNQLPDFGSMTPDNSSLVDDLSIDDYTGATDFGLHYEGYIYLTPGEYTFSLDSDDGSRFLLDRIEVINYDGAHGKGRPKVQNITITEARFYKFDLEYFQKGSGIFLALLMGKDGAALEPIAPTSLFHFEPQEPDPSIVVAAYGQAILVNKTEVLVPHCFTNPVFFAKLMTTIDDEPGVVEGTFKGCTNNNESKFELSFKEFEYLDGRHPQEMVAILAAEEGHYDLEDGSALTISRMNLTSNAWAPVPFVAKTSTVDGQELYLGQVQSSLESHARVIRMQTNNNVKEFTLQAEEALTKNNVESHSEVGILKLIKYNQLLFQTRLLKAKQRWVNLEFPNDNIYHSTFFSDMLTFEGSDTAYSIVDRINNTTMKIKSKEERSLDREEKHAEELLGLIFFPAESGVIKGIRRN